ncbi:MULTISPECIES: L-threonylcarbamoyladenylate synthase [unclassified Sphingomonas]|uniref:L-threonylcarbamoyladenylate synthase n=1 Tax=unclassified Sphingomonas TaxID=196159 RepID=UPI0021515134|nr:MULTISPECIES: L-threonylcarbamoyladenylate synthase [unclassified Sphingomonas]MCR5871442.1 threonylcarbamoyl-AMP synthase [Sphingomonas sp. J344]UUY00260.1 threonylcarbamoyl-AMP synthase [Sphingomonas sp. J315]
MTAPNMQILPYGEAAIAQAAAIIAAGGCVATPTETVYGLAADATNAEAVAGIYAAKGRPSFNPLIVHVADRRAAEAIAMFDRDARALADAFWPGPLTLVLPLRPDAPIAGLVTAGLSTVAIRVPQHRAMQALLAATGKPLAAPSANASGSISPTRASHVAASLADRIPLVIDDGATSGGIESTIVALGAQPRLLRPGPISAADIEREIGRWLGVAGDKVEAPGQLASHYAPRKPLRLNATEARAGEWLIGFSDVAGDDTLSASGDVVEAAARLFDALHRADASDRAGIAVAPVPDGGIGLAINDRLQRAAVR